MSPLHLRRPASSHPSRRGTLRAPGADLRKLPVALDLSGISIAEGLRAAVASGAVLVLNIWVQSPALLFIAFAANLACFCDVGGALRDRVPSLLFFTGAAAVLWSGLGLLHGFGLPLLLPVTGVVVFCNAMARVWGVRAMAVGNVLTVVLALAVDRAIPPAEAAVLFVAFLVGGAWAVLLTVGIWRIHPERIGTRMVSANWRLLALFARDLGDVLRAQGGGLAEFEAHARAHRRALRDALEETRAALLAAARPSGLAGTVVARNMLAVEDQDRIFGALIALSDMLEYAEGEALPRAAGQMLRRLRPMLDLAGRPGTPRARGHEPALERLKRAAAGHPALADIASVVADRLRIAARLKAEDAGTLPAEPASGGAGRLDAWIAPVRANLSWSSAILRHAVRASVLTMAAVAISLTWWSVYSHWLTITVALTMQPYFAATWQRALERVGGTVLGALIGGLLAFLPQTALVDSLLMVPLSVIGFSVRQVSYGAYVACLTPLVVILFDVAEPGHAEWLIATMRTLYTVGGGIVAVAACCLLWPSWEPDRTAQGLRDALAAHARYAAAVFAARAGNATPADVEAARRVAGVANNNLEASLSRALQEPGRGHRRRLEVIMAADAALRRLGGALIALQHDTHAADGLGEGGWTAWSRWVPETLDRLALSGAAPAVPPPPAPPAGTLARIGRVVEVLGDVVGERTADAAPTADRGAATATAGVR
ncbi:FUSC family protein [Lichenibacterium minor]|uniref:FUSC family protein n=1 Tax=Lichenibacterium minor TaxID=2316528 RepID=A0A4Q2U2F2_9HYPH|nr:FUSC family protein [Lichenibacterium minor]RYC30689.1 FUSC family protein [Lichenibacterium minor]